MPAKPPKKELVTSVKGMHDIIFEDVHYLERVIKEVRRTAEFYGFSPIMTPHLEKAELFSRPLGETSDVVEKQMYNLRTRGGDRLTLRPEETAPAMRAYFEHGMQSMPQPVKLFYSGSFFRHESPQASRFREFRQAGLEIIGDEDAINDAVVVRIFVSSIQALGIRDVVVNINSLGDKTCRPAFRKELLTYYKKHFNDLCKDCKRRFKENPLRLLDCKEPACQVIKKDAPQMMDFLCEACKKHFGEVLEYLDEMGIAYFLDIHLVRGFDYYGRTVFEIFTDKASPEIEMAGIALASGGRYDDLAELLGARRVPGVGGALGVERVAELMKKRNIKPRPEVKPKMFLIQLGPAAKKKSLVLMEELRKIGVPIAHSISKDSLRSQLNIVSKLRIPLALILGQKEALDGTVGVRNMDSGIQETLPFDKFIGTIKARLKEFS
ncbi:MAG: histidine--tRNA ligase [Candidatus Ryanbacteria bacterium]|nr:histidine--tRNA ligase [Candidatus Ryanbacteria bacterium]